MKTITVVVNNDNDAERVRKFIRSTSFEEEVETYEEELTIPDEELQVLNERWERYEKNPASALSLDEFKAYLRKKHGT